MSKMITAVEWLIEQLAINGIIHSSDINKAKEMEEEQIKEAYLSGADHVMDVQYNPTSYFDNEQYYKETYESKR